VDVGHILRGQQQRKKATQQQIFKMPANNSLARIKSKQGTYINI
jgi:hypothetical protein